MIMDIGFMFLLMLELHVVDDFYLQGILAKMKQQSWWKEQPEYKELYANDWGMALWIHAFSWTFMVHLPLFYHYGWKATTSLVISFWINMIIHACVDHLKANEKSINLVTDQMIHIIQVIVTLRVLY